MFYEVLKEVCNLHVQLSCFCLMGNFWKSWTVIGKESANEPRVAKFPNMMPLPRQRFHVFIR